MNMNRVALNVKEQGQVNGGLVIGSCSKNADPLNKEYKKRIKIESRVKKMQQIADIRMRAADAALKAAMRLDRQEMGIREAMKADRLCLVLN